ncbi:transcriptional regulator [Gilliamella apicola]|uniref:Transcriptional regulator n=1 Tax=Gilliamella apicola TaxID=1196095 RepID=A0A2V4DVW7_9GAMM|nr:MULTISPECIES: helix-turn-helix domain-containing protein [Gilliamella]OTQ79456.1 transcriptional regulator [Gilliamella sp. N-W3]PXZ04373.1 transcriptional regulator [Gilliamella apicola]
MENTAIKKAISIVGSQAKLAKACGKTQTSVWKWANNKSDVSPEIVPLIVEATNGVVKAYEIRPDLPLLFPHE